MSQKRIPIFLALALFVFSCVNFISAESGTDQPNTVEKTANEQKPTAGQPKSDQSSYVYDLKKLIENTFETAAVMAAGGERVRFPVIGALVRKEVKARKAGKGTNPFTGEPMDIKARPASKKPRWSFPRSLKDTFGNKRNW